MVNNDSFFQLFRQSQKRQVSRVPSSSFIYKRNSSPSKSNQKTIVDILMKFNKKINLKIKIFLMAISIILLIIAFIIFLKWVFYLGIILFLIGWILLTVNILYHTYGKREIKI